MERSALAALLAAEGFVAAEEEAEELLAAAAGDDDRLRAMVARRRTGEPLAWITGTTRFCGVDLVVHPGVYVPRWQTRALAERAAQRLPLDGVAVDLCTGSGAVARVLMARAPRARVVAADLDPRAVACARENGVEAYHGDLFDPLPPEVAGSADVVFAVVPYVPTGELPLLQRDTLTFEDRRHYDGGPDGTLLLRRVVAGAPRALKPGGALIVELGGDQAAAIADDLAVAGFRDVEVLADEDGDVRGVEALLSAGRR